MFNSVQFVRDVCQQKRIPVSALEKACGFSNGYLNPKKMTRIPYDRAVLIGKYLGVSVSRILTGEEGAISGQDSVRPVSDEDIKFALFGGDGEITDAMYDEVKRFAAFIKQREADRSK